MYCGVLYIIFIKKDNLEKCDCDFENLKIQKIYFENLCRKSQN